jgi:RHS repeat-associated protein
MGLCAFVLGASCGDGGVRLSARASIFNHPDHLGGVAVQTDGAGRVVTEATFDPYGAPIVRADGPHGFSGKEFDPTTELYDFGARVYDPKLGLFLSPDPAVLEDPGMAIADPQLLNPYAYVRNSPISQIDPDGRAPRTTVGAAVGRAALREAPAIVRPTSSPLGGTVVHSARPIGGTSASGRGGAGLTAEPTPRALAPKPSPSPGKTNDLGAITYWLLVKSPMAKAEKFAFVNVVEPFAHVGATVGEFALLPVTLANARSGVLKNNTLWGITESGLDQSARAMGVRTIPGVVRDLFRQKGQEQGGK